MTAVLGREAAYRGTEVTWKQLVDENAALELDTTGLRD